MSAFPQIYEISRHTQHLVPYTEPKKRPRKLKGGNASFLGPPLRTQKNFFPDLACQERFLGNKKAAAMHEILPQNRDFIFAMSAAVPH